MKIHKRMHLVMKESHFNINAPFPLYLDPCEHCQVPTWRGQYGGACRINPKDGRSCINNDQPEYFRPCANNINHLDSNMNEFDQCYAKGLNIVN